VQLDFKVRENIHQGIVRPLMVYYLDFIAKVRFKTGGYKNVLIELQKSNHPYDIIRFRNYLGEQYKQVDEIVHEDGSVSKETLPIITIYFLGFYISKTLPAVIKVDRRYIDVLGGGIELDEQNYFIERLSHNSYIIQIPALKLQMRNRLEYVLSVFQQEKFIDNTHRLKGYDFETDDPLMQKIIKLLGKVAADTELLRVMELEEIAERQYECNFGDIEKRLIERDIELEQSKKAIEQNKKTIEQNQKAIEQNQKTIEQSKKTIEQNQKTIEQNQKVLKEKDRYIKELLEKLELK
jgi:hypothetical protein